MYKNIKSKLRKLALTLIGQKEPIDKDDIPTKTKIKPPAHVPMKIKGGVKFRKKWTPRYGGRPRNNTKYK